MTFFRLSPQEQLVCNADILADELEMCGHDDISSTDLLDCLATTGLTLSYGPGPAIDAYNAVLRSRAEEE